MALDPKQPFEISSAESIGSGRFYYKLNTNQGTFYYAPAEWVQKGLVQNGIQYYESNFVNNKDLLTGSPIIQIPQGVATELERAGYSTPTKGFIFTEDQFNKIDSGVNNYTIDPNNPRYAPIQGLTDVVKTVNRSGKPTSNRFTYFLGSDKSGNKTNFYRIGDAGTNGVTTLTVSAPGGILGSFVRAIGSVPLLPEIAGAVTGNPMVYAALKGTQLGLSGVDPLKAGLQVGATIAAPSIVKNVLPTELASIPGVSQGIGTAGVSLLAGASPEEALKAGLASGVGTAVGGQVSGATEGALGTDISKALGNIAGGASAATVTGGNAAQAALAAGIGSAATSAGQAAGNLVNRSLFGGTPQTGVGTMDDYTNGGVQLFDDGSSIFFDNRGNVVGGIDNTGSQFNAPGFNLQIFDDGTFLATDPNGALSFSTTDAPLFTGNAVVGSIGAGLSSTASDALTSTLSKVASQATSAGTKSLLNRLLGGASSAINQALGANTSEQQLATLLQGLLNRGIDYATAEKIANQVRAEGQAIQTAATRAGAEAAVPFTPYTVTSGLGTSTVGPTGATTTLAPEYAGIRGQAAEQAAQALGAIAPAQATQSLFGQLEGLAGPARQREQEQLLSRLGASGLLGIGRNLPTVGGGIAGVNPFVESLLSAQQTAQAQNALAATQFGTQEAQRQQALAQSLLGMSTGLDTLGTQQLTQAGNLGQLPLTAQQLNAQRQLEATLGGLRASVPFSTTAANIQAGQTGMAGQTVQDLITEIFK
jgi:hypothetical protein